MFEKAGKISDSELEVMKLLWDTGEPMTVTDIRQHLQESCGWEATTIKTLVQRLVDKGALEQEKRRVFYYRPLISRQEYNDWATGNLIRKLYRGRARDLVAALVDSSSLSREDIDELRSFFTMEEDK